VKLRKERFATDADIEIEGTYGPDSLQSLDAERDLGAPGQFPYTRGVRETMYRGQLWTMRQYAGFGTAEESNRRYHFLLGQGQTGLSVAFDLPTQMGRDSDHPLASGEVGKVGVAIDSLEDMRVLLDGLPLDQVSTSMTINATAATLLCLYIAVADERGVPRDKLRGTIQNDILKEYIARGTYIYPPKASMRVITDTFTDRMRSRRSRSRSPTGSPTSRRRSTPGSTSTSSRRGWRSSSTSTTTSSKRSPSSAPRAGCGRGS